MHIFYAHNNFFCFNFFIIVICVVLLARTTASLNCYVCGLEANFSCSSFNNSNKDLFSQDCPLKTRGCSTQLEDDKITNMGCDVFALDKCLMANGIAYCYCTTNLCNGNTSITKSISHNTGLNDDEDLSEGSGFKLFTTTDSQTFSTSTLPPSISIANTGDCLQSTFIVIFIALILP